MAETPAQKRRRVLEEAKRKGRQVADGVDKGSAYAQRVSGQVLTSAQNVRKIQQTLNGDGQRSAPAAPGQTPAPQAPGQPADREMTPEQERVAQEKHKTGADILTPYECPIGDGKADVLETLIAYVNTLRDHQGELAAHGVDPLPEEHTPENLRRWWDSGKDIDIAAIRQDGWTLLDAHGDYQSAQQDLAERMGGFHEVWNDDPSMKALDKFKADQQRVEADLERLRAQGDTVRKVADHVQQALYAKRDHLGQNLSALIGLVGNNGPDFEKRVQSAIAIWGWTCPSAVGADGGEPFRPGRAHGVGLQDVLRYCHARYTSQLFWGYRDKWYVTQNFWEELNRSEASGQNALGVLASVKPDELREMGVPQYVEHGEGNKTYADDKFVAEDLKKMRDAINGSCQTMSDLHTNMKKEIAGYYDVLHDALDGADQTERSDDNGGEQDSGRLRGANSPDGGAGRGNAGTPSVAGASDEAPATEGHLPSGAGTGETGAGGGSAFGPPGQALGSAGQSSGQAMSGLGSALGGALQGLMGSLGQMIQCAQQAAGQAQPPDRREDGKTQRPKDGGEKGETGGEHDRGGKRDGEDAPQRGDGRPDPHASGPTVPNAASRAPTIVAGPSGMGSAAAEATRAGTAAREQADTDHGDFEVRATVRQVGAGSGNQGHIAGFE